MYTVSIGGGSQECHNYFSIVKGVFSTQDKAFKYFIDLISEKMERSGDYYDKADVAGIHSGWEFGKISDVNWMEDVPVEEKFDFMRDIFGHAESRTPRRVDVMISRNKFIVEWSVGGYAISIKKIPLLDEPLPESGYDLCDIELIKRHKEECDCDLGGQSWRTIDIPDIIKRNQEKQRSLKQ